jgi:hypothetical protein
VKDEVYGYSGRIECLLNRIRQSAGAEQNKKKILEFYHECIMRGYSKARTIKYLYTLDKTVSMLKKPFSAR